MPMTPGLNPNLRLQQDEPEAGLAPAEDVIIEISEGSPKVDTDDRGNIMRIEHDDGSVSLSLDGKPIEEASRAERAQEWFANLVDDIDAGTLNLIADDLLRGVRDDIESRKDWIEDRAQGIKLLGLTVEIPGLQGATDGAPVEGMSRVRHPLLLEAVLRFQANSRSEMLPTDGPVKVRVDSIGTTIQTDFLADALEKDFNAYLTAVAKEYYPDTDRMLFMLGFGGTAFKKVYFCPLRGRPVSETVDADDLIVNNSATTLQDAKRITHRVYAKASTVRRLQILGVYRDIDLATPMFEAHDAVQREKAEQQGIAVEARNPEDREREIYEIYCELDIPGFEHKYRGQLTGLEIPYRVTIDLSSREVLSIVRNYDEPTGDEGDELPEARQNFVKYTFVPGMGFYDIGLLHILGNTTNAVTAAWREMLDAGMYANFPGFLMADTGARQNTNIFRVPPGGGALVKTGGLPINQAIMPLPYKEPGGAMMTLVSNMVETGQRVGGTAELAVGEGRQDAPVGTTLALIDQATKVMNAVHKRMHAAQADEFQLMLRCFREHPNSFWKKLRGPSLEWNESIFNQAINNYELVPQADPNTASHTQRVMKIMALKQLQQANPSMYDAVAIDRAAMKAMGWSNPEQFIAAPSAPVPPPEAQAKMAELQIKKQEADTKQMLAQAEVAKIQSEMGVAGQDGQQLDPNKMIDIQMKQAEIRQKEMDLELKRMELEQAMRQSGMDMQMQQADITAKMRQNIIDQKDNELDNWNRQKDRESSERIAAVKLAQDVMKTPGGYAEMKKILSPDLLRTLESREDTPPSSISGLE
jgi:hypothetical protein